MIVGVGFTKRAKGLVKGLALRKAELACRVEPANNIEPREVLNMTQNEPVDLTGEELESVMGENSVVVVDCWADWCAPCKMVEPIMESLAENYGDQAFFGKLNVDEERETALEYQISSIPTILFFQDGELTDRVIGAVPEEQLEEKVKEIIG